MNVFKTRVGSGCFIPINDESFIAATGKTQPYFEVGRDHVDRYYAVCPICDNPIQIIGLFKQELDSGHRRPYGKHCKSDIAKLARYDEEAYLACPFADPGYAYKGAKRKPASKTGAALHQLMKEQFDRIVYIWSKTTGIKMSTPFAKQLLMAWVANEGWRNYDSTYQNLPYMLLYAQPAYNLVGRLIAKESDLYCALAPRKNLDLVDHDERYAKVMGAQNTWPPLTFYLAKHRYDVVDDSLKETFELKVADGRKTLYRRSIEVDHGFLDRLMALPPERRRRDEKLLAIAATVME